MFVAKDIRYFDEECQIYAIKTVLDVEMLKAENNQRRSCTDTCPVLTDNNMYVGAASLLVATAAAASKNTEHWQQRIHDCQLQKRKNQQTIMQNTAKSDLSEIERQYCSNNSCIN